jgi:hypothetical protein
MRFKCFGIGLLLFFSKSVLAVQVGDYVKWWDESRTGYQKQGTVETVSEGMAEILLNNSKRVIISTEELTVIDKPSYCDSFFHDNENLKNICIGLVYSDNLASGTEFTGCGRLPESDQKMGCYWLAIVMNDSVDCGDMRKYPEMKHAPEWMLEGCLEARINQEHWKPTALENWLSTKDENLKNLRVAFGMRWEDLLEPKVPVITRKKMQSSCTWRDAAEDEVKEVQKWIDSIKTPIDNKLEELKHSELAQTLGLSKLTHGIPDHPEVDDISILASILESGGLLSPKLQTLNSDNLPPGHRVDKVFMTGVSEQTGIFNHFSSNKFATVNNIVFVFSPQLLDTHPKFHVSEGTPSGEFKHSSSASHSDKRRLNSIFEKIGTVKGYSNEFVFQAKVDLDNLIEIYIPRKKFEKLEQALAGNPELLFKYINKFRILQE